MQCRKASSLILKPKWATAFLLASWLQLNQKFLRPIWGKKWFFMILRWDIIHIFAGFFIKICKHIRKCKTNHWEGGRVVKGLENFVNVLNGSLFNIPNFLVGSNQRYTYRVLQRIQMKLILLWALAERAVLGSTKTALKFKYEI